MINGRITKEIRNKIMNTSRPSTVGKIKIGETTTRTKRDGVTTYQIPKALDYFIAKSENLTYVEMYNDLIGKTSNLTITFESDKLNEVCFERLVYRDGAGKNIAYGDGEIFNVWSKLEKKYIQTNISAIDLKKQLNLDGKVEFTLIFKIMELIYLRKLLVTFNVFNLKLILPLAGLVVEIKICVVGKVLNGV